RQPATGNRQLATGNRQYRTPARLTAGPSSPALPVAGCRLPVPCSLLPLRRPALLRLHRRRRAPRIPLAPGELLLRAGIGERQRTRLRAGLAALDFGIGAAAYCA